MCPEVLEEILHTLFKIQHSFPRLAASRFKFCVGSYVSVTYKSKKGWIRNQGLLYFDLDKTYSIL